MKKLVLLCLVLPLLLIGCKKEKAEASIVGTWDFVSSAIIVEGEPQNIIDEIKEDIEDDLDEGEHDNSYIIFNADGTLAGGGMGDDETATYVKNGNVISIIDDGTVVGKLNIRSITETTLVIFNDYMPMVKNEYEEEADGITKAEAQMTFTRR